MDNELVVVIAFATVVFGAFAFWGQRLAKLRRYRTLGGLAAIWAGFTALMYFAMQNAPGWDGLAFAIALLVLCAPSGAGVLIGAPVGWLRGKGTTHA